LKGVTVTDKSIHSSHPIVGTWRLTSFTEQNLETGAMSYPFGEGAKALVIYEAAGYVVTIFTKSDRKPPIGPQPTDQEAMDLYRSMIAFAGRYELEGNRLIYHPEISWNEAWNGTTQERVTEVSGDRLETNSVPTISPVTGARTVFSLVWERI
jgi:Lipocalin-like domain